MSSDEMKLILEKLEKLDEMESRQRIIETGVMNLGTRLEALENKVEERLQDTRPMWQTVQSQLKELREGQEKLSEEQAELREGQKNIASELRLLRKAFSRSYSDMLITQVSGLTKS
jgi:chromosome segregation ATPase